MFLSIIDRLTDADENECGWHKQELVKRQIYYGAILGNCLPKMRNSCVIPMIESGGGFLYPTFNALCMEVVHAKGYVYLQKK